VKIRRDTSGKDNAYTNRREGVEGPAAVMGKKGRKQILLMGKVSSTKKEESTTLATCGKKEMRNAGFSTFK